MRRYFFVYLLCMVVCLPGFSRAEDEKTDKKELAIMDEVVVTATKTEEKRSDVPNSIILLDKYDIQESSAQSLGELLANELGIDWRTYGNYGGASQEVHIRGMSGDGTQIFINGVNINSPSLGTADVGKIPLNNIERIEVVKGSGSVLYGSGAMGGTINIITKSPEKDESALMATAGYGTNNAYVLSAEQGMFLSEYFGYYMTANRRETDGFRDNSDLTQNDVSLKLILDRGKDLYVSLYGDYIDREHGLPGTRPPAGTQEFSVDGELLYNSEAANLLSNGGDEDAYFALNIKSHPFDGFGLRLRGDYSDTINYNNNRWYLSFPVPALSGSRTWTTNKVTGVGADVEIESLKDLNFLMGVEYKYYDWENKGISLDSNGAEIPATKTTTDEDLHTTGYFGEIQYQLHHTLKALAGLRHEEHSEFGTEDLPRFGIIYNPWEETALKVSHGKHFRAPTPNDLFWPDDGFTRGNPNLNPEKGWHSDATIEQSLFNDGLFLTVSYFFWDVEDKIQWGPDSNGVWTPENLRTYKADGIEIGMMVRYPQNMVLGLNYTYLDAEEENKAFTIQDYGLPANFQYFWIKRRAAYTPQHQFKGNVSYWFDFGLIATATMRYVDERFWYRTETDGVYPATKTVTYSLDPYWTTDVKVQQMLYNHWTFSLQCNNLFDEEYDTNFDTFTDQSTFTTTVTTYPGAGRSIFFTVTYEF